jgi:hypothetical protein
MSFFDDIALFFTGDECDTQGCNSHKKAVDGGKAPPVLDSIFGNGASQSFSDFFNSPDAARLMFEYAFAGFLILFGFKFVFSLI